MIYSLRVRKLYRIVRIKHKCDVILFYKIPHDMIHVNLRHCVEVLNDTIT